MSKTGIITVIERVFGNIERKPGARYGRYKKIREGIERDFCARSDNPVIAIAPVRSEPKRIYQTIAGRKTPEGEHVPVDLRRLKINEPVEWEMLHKDLLAFGKQSGLYTDISIKDYGGPRGPFQLQVKVGSSRRSIIDVGYGISQVLPILVELFLFTLDSRTLLLQQPEVHLHPKGQAALASFLVDAVNSKGSTFVVETHSDHIVDRLRIEVLSGKLSPDMVSLLYFSPTARSGVRIHSLELGKRGNVINAPQHYREFFMTEVNRMLGDV